MSIQIQGFWRFIPTEAQLPKILGDGFASFPRFSNMHHWVGITPELRIFPKGKAPLGFFIAPYYRYQQYIDIVNPDQGPYYEEQGTFNIIKMRFRYLFWQTMDI